jgi:hypothetical protein
MRNGVWIRNLESSLLEVVTVIKQGSADEQRAFWINDDSNAVGFHQNVPVCRTIHKIHLVLQARTPAAYDRDSERALRSTLPLQQL